MDEEKGQVGADSQTCFDHLRPGVKGNEISWRVKRPSPEKSTCSQIVMKWVQVGRVQLLLDLMKKVFGKDIKGMPFVIQFEFDGG